jgi:hypothetical protein
VVPLAIPPEETTPASSVLTILPAATTFSVPLSLLV